MRKTAIISIIFLLSCGMMLADFPGVKFVAAMEGLAGPAEGPWILTIMATSSQTIDVIVDDSTEIEDGLGNSLTPDGLAALPEGTIVKIAAVFMEEGLYARAVNILKHDDAFEIKGQVDSVDCGSGLIGLLGFEIVISPDAEIRGAEGESLTCEDIIPGQFIKAKGMVEDSALIATSVTVGIPGKEQLVVEFDAVVEEMADNEWLVAIGGQNPGATVPVLVVLDDNTEVIGTIEVGTEVEITGVLTPDLAVLARLIKVEGLKKQDKGYSGKKGDDSGDIGDDDSLDGDDEANNGNNGKKDDNPGKKGNPPGQDKSGEAGE